MNREELESRIMLLAAVEKTLEDQALVIKHIDELEEQYTYIVDQLVPQIAVYRYELEQDAGDRASADRLAHERAESCPSKYI